MKNEGPSCDVIENTWSKMTDCHPTCDVIEAVGFGCAPGGQDDVQPRVRECGAGGASLGVLDGLGPQQDQIHHPGRDDGDYDCGHEDLDQHAALHLLH